MYGCIERATHEEMYLYESICDKECQKIGGDFFQFDRNRRRDWV